jgi:hypothetical protein
LGVRRHHLCRQHRLDFVLRADTRYRCPYLVNVLFARRIFLAPIACSIQDAVEHQEGMIDLGGAEGGHETGVIDPRVVIYMERFAGLRHDL